ncbi:MAG: hypothetical protein HYZ79_07555 [Candidatus Melainabacteria bacterium]|nr:hypothetical protein [Candidatus Melainabacteria bacterium]
MFKQIKGITILAIVLLCFCLAYGCLTNAEDENTVEDGGKIFKNCSGCHLKGQNLIKEDKPIIGSAKLKKKETFKEFISEPHPPMPSFKKIAENPQKLDALYKYVSSLMSEK